jgi:glutamate formiminotransferase/formiminotetrahydrofolate cyclodeaminase
VKDANGESIKIPGTLKAVKAMGVLVERFQIAQVSINLVDFETTSMHQAFEEVRKQARTLGADATGSELVGLTPLRAMLLAATHFAKGRQLSEQEAVSLAIERLGLSQLEPFDPAKKIIEYQL